jgi:hypothetical protein
VKKVRLVAVGAVGLTPALGLMMMPSAAAAPTHTPKRTAKAVSLEHGNMLPAAGCIGRFASKAHSRNFHISLFHTPSTQCVGGVSAYLSKDCDTGFVLRTRAYSTSTKGTRTEWLNTTVGGHFRSCRITSPTGSIVYYQGIHQVRRALEQVCEAVVFASNHDKVWRGPVCISL